MFVMLLLPIPSSPRHVFQIPRIPPHCTARNRASMGFLFRFPRTPFILIGISIVRLKLTQFKFIELLSYIFGPLFFARPLLTCWFRRRRRHCGVPRLKTIMSPMDERSAGHAAAAATLVAIINITRSPRLRIWPLVDQHWAASVFLCTRIRAHTGRQMVGSLFWMFWIVGH